MAWPIHPYSRLAGRTQVKPKQSTPISTYPEKWHAYVRQLISDGKTHVPCKFCGDPVSLGTLQRTPHPDGEQCDECWGTTIRLADFLRTGRRAREFVEAALINNNSRQHKT